MKKTNITNNSIFTGYSLKEEEFSLISSLVYKNSGINLPSTKKELVRARLAKRLRALNIDTFTAYYNYVKADQSGEELIQLLNVISTNKTEFFREIKHFNFIKRFVLPQIINRNEGERHPRIRIWSAGCSTGEEPYSIAITLLNQIPGYSKWDIKILAVDLCTKVLRTAMEGIYHKDSLTSVPPIDINRYFESIQGIKVSFKAQDDLKRLITFRRMDIINDPYRFKGGFDIIFCRNVMIYFDKETRSRLISKFYNVLKPGGHLLLGHSESISNDLRLGLKTVESTIYQKVSG